MKLRSGLFCGSPPEPKLVPPLLTQQNLRALDDETISRTNDSEIASSDSMPSSTDPMFPTLLKQKGVYFNIRDASPPEDWKAVFMDLQKKRNEPDKQQIQELFQPLGYIYNERNI
jgi:hypothetical protein